jgi:hypothetical protein
MEDVEKELDKEDLDLEDEILDAGEGGCLDMTQEVGPPIQCMSMDICKRGFANRTRTMDKNAILPSTVDFLLKKLQPESPTSPSKPRPRVPFAPPEDSQSAQTGCKVKRERCHWGVQCL